MDNLNCTNEQDLCYFGKGAGEYRVAGTQLSGILYYPPVDLSFSSHYWRPR